MPLVNITLNPDYRLRKFGMDGPNSVASAITTRKLVKGDLARALPQLLVRHADVLGLEPGTPAEAVQVMRHEYDSGDVNIANVWITFQFSEEIPPLARRHDIRDNLYNLVVWWFRDLDFQPEDLVIDLFWGPTNGCGMVNGVSITW